ncbi:hypothetical protein B0H19DRAFT_1064400 [Mycena capillaripes]|nr:hypothetical protein B0H19DRAFT_1064400 [Mycena capillaripes]
MAVGFVVAEVLFQSGFEDREQVDEDKGYFFLEQQGRPFQQSVRTSGSSVVTFTPGQKGTHVVSHAVDACSPHAESKLTEFLWADKVCLCAGIVLLAPGNNACTKAAFHLARRALAYAGDTRYEDESWCNCYSSLCILSLLMQVKPGTDLTVNFRTIFKRRGSWAETSVHGPVVRQVQAIRQTGYKSEYFKQKALLYQSLQTKVIHVRRNFEARAHQKKARHKPG